MKLDYPLDPHTLLRLSTELPADRTYPTARIQKGLILLHQGRELCEEAVGFGVPIVLCGLQTYFPGSVELSPAGEQGSARVEARYALNLVEKIRDSARNVVDHPFLYAGKNLLSAAIRRLPFLRRTLTRASSLLRARLELETSYEPLMPGDSFPTVTLVYTPDLTSGRLHISLSGVEPGGKSITKIVIMNEQGAHAFDEYRDTLGNILHGDAIGCWNRVSAQEASFVNRELRLAFSLPQVPGADLYRGRELVGTRLAWSGFGYTIPPATKYFTCTLRIHRI